MSTPWIAAFVALTVLVIAQSIVLLGLVSKVTTALERAEVHTSSGPQPGTPLPALELEDADGAPATVGEPPLVLLMLNPRCGPCARLLERLNRTKNAPPDRVVAIIDVAARPAPVPPWLTVLYQRDGTADRALRLDRTPLALTVDNDGRIAATRVPVNAADLLVSPFGVVQKSPEL
ncbi:hypothetical protein Lesp02_37440 [Lentzea sp. NBRC 105346]|uniref:TlpA family protein disulfide reductase n=1 Tax=Lentzea sp. NBRC 105346 TaxID=3032205 RepID=UPI0024A178C5|nr:hypothetical protein [Lentzea sp. NBRC 105346]GLZ31556.1 hypothetical protein Lesp02_37440 [Lentzea sp. NBRC 105346]